MLQILLHIVPSIPYSFLPSYPLNLSVLDLPPPPKKTLIIIIALHNCTCLTVYVYTFFWTKAHLLRRISLCFNFNRKCQFKLRIEWWIRRGKWVGTYLTLLMVCVRCILFCHMFSFLFSTFFIQIIEFMLHYY